MAKQSTAKKEISSKREDMASGPRDDKAAQKSAAPHLDRLIHERLRLGIISALAANESGKVTGSSATFGGFSIS